MMELYLYIEYAGDVLPIEQISVVTPGKVKPIMWAQNGRYGWISKEQIQNLMRRQKDLTKQQKGYARVKPIDLGFHWSEVQLLDPATVKSMRETS